MTELGHDGKDLDGVDPTSTVSGTDAPPFPSHPGVGTESADRDEEEDRDQCDVEDAKKRHVRTRSQEEKTGVGVGLSHYQGCFYSVSIEDRPLTDARETHDDV